MKLLKMETSSTTTTTTITMTHWIIIIIVVNFNLFSIASCCLDQNGYYIEDIDHLNSVRWDLGVGQASVKDFKSDNSNNNNNNNNFSSTLFQGYIPKLKFKYTCEMGDFTLQQWPIYQSIGRLFINHVESGSCIMMWIRMTLLYVKRYGCLCLKDSHDNCIYFDIRDDGDVENQTCSFWSYQYQQPQSPKSPQQQQQQQQPINAATSTKANYYDSPKGSEPSLNNHPDRFTSSLLPTTTSGYSMKSWFGIQTENLNRPREKNKANQAVNYGEELSIKRWATNSDSSSSSSNGGSIAVTSQENSPSHLSSSKISFSPSFLSLLSLLHVLF